MHRELKQHERSSLGWSKQGLAGVLLTAVTAVSSALLLVVLTSVVQPQFAHAQAGGQRVGGTDGGGVGSADRTAPGTEQPGSNNGGDQAGDGEQSGQPAPRRRWIPRPPSGPGCPYRGRQLELIV